MDGNVEFKLEIENTEAVPSDAALAALARLLIDYADQESAEQQKSEDLGNPAP